MPDAAEQLLPKIWLGQDLLLECEEVVFASDRVRGPIESSAHSGGDHLLETVHRRR